MAATKLKCCVGQEKDETTSFIDEYDDSEEEPVNLKSYRRYWIRWVMLLALFILNISNGTVSALVGEAWYSCIQTEVSTKWRSDYAMLMDAVTRAVSVQSLSISSFKFLYLFCRCG